MVSLFFKTLDDILLLKPESVVNPWLKSMGRDRKHDVSDCIGRLNEKIKKNNVLYVENSDISEEKNEPFDGQLSFNFDD